MNLLSNKKSLGNVNKTVDRIVIGRFGRAHGVKGLITVHSFTDPFDNILRYVDWHVCIHKKWQPLNVLQMEVRNKSIVVKIEGYNDREQAATLTNLDITVDKIQLPSLSPGDYYWHELVGMQVINQHEVLLGTVVELMSTGANDVLIVEGSKRHLIPYLPGQFVSEVSTDQQMIRVEWDEDF